MKNYNLLIINKIQKNYFKIKKKQIQIILSNLKINKPIMFEELFEEESI